MISVVTFRSTVVAKAVSTLSSYSSLMLSEIVASHSTVGRLNKSRLVMIQFILRRKKFDPPQASLDSSGQTCPLDRLLIFIQMSSTA